MGALMICCPATGSKISLGVEIDPVSFDRTPDFVAAFYCASCAIDHLWSKTDAWIEAADFKRSTRKKPGAGAPLRAEALRERTWSFARALTASKMSVAAA
jgi:hypothetical protein